MAVPAAGMLNGGRGGICTNTADVTSRGRASKTVLRHSVCTAPQCSSDMPAQQAAPDSCSRQPRCQQQQQVEGQQRHHSRPQRRDRRAAALNPLPQRLLLALGVAVVTLLLPAGGPSLQPAAATEINSAVSIFGPWDYEQREDGTSRCTDMVQRTAELGHDTRTMFLPTLFWVSKHEDGFFERTAVS